MKLRLTILFLFAINSITFGQSVDYNKIIPPTNLPNLEFSEKLVYLAWRNHPSNQVLIHQKNIAENNKTKASWAWLEIITASYNLNEFTINPTEETKDRALFYPRYNFGARLNLAMLTDIPGDIKIAKEGIEIAKATINNQKIALRAQVLRAYQNYLLAKQILEIQTISTEEAFSRYSLNEQRFKNGEITLEEYNEAVKAYNSERKGKLNAESDFNIAKIDLEELIGLKLEEIE